MPSAYTVHPEFGYFCPSPRLRRGIRLAFAMLVLGLIAGARSVMTTPGSYDAGATSAEWRADQALAPAPVPAMAAIKTSCGENAPASRNGECVSSKPLKVRIVHAPTNAPAICTGPSRPLHLAASQRRCLRGTCWECARSTTGVRGAVRADTSGGRRCDCRSCDGAIPPVDCRSEAAKEGAQSRPPARSGLARQRVMARGALGALERA